MPSKFNKFIKRTVSGISALSIIASGYAGGSFSSIAADDAAKTPVCGDINCDDKIDVADLIKLNKYLKDSEKNPLTEQGKINADCNRDGYITIEDADTLLGAVAKINDLPSAEVPAIHIGEVIGDVNTDGCVDINDINNLNAYLKDSDKNPLTNQGKINADCNKDGYITQEDVDVILGAIAKINDLPSVEVPAVHIGEIIGDVNTDGCVDINDINALNAYLKDSANNWLTDQGKINADCNKDGYITQEDVDVILGAIAKINDLPSVEVPAVHIKEIIGDVNTDGCVDIYDLTAMNAYMKDPAENPLTEQGKINADCNKDGYITVDDTYAMIASFAKMVSLPTTEIPAISNDKAGTDEKSNKSGDFNCDGNVDITDALLLNNYLQDNSTYTPSKQGLSNADVFKPGYGRTFDDVLAIAESIAGMTELPTNVLNTPNSETKHGDFNCDGVVDISDAVMLDRYLQDNSTYAPSKQGLKNADVFKPGYGHTFEDVQAICESIAGTTELPTNALNTPNAAIKYGDFNCDGVVDISDAVMLTRYLQDNSTYTPSKQGLANADVFKPGYGHTFDDAQAICESIAGMTELPTNALNTPNAKRKYGDFNCDGVVNISDAIMLNRYLLDNSSYSPSKRGLNNADVYKPGYGLTEDDAYMIANGDLPVETTTSATTTVTTKPTTAKTEPATTTSTTTKAKPTTTTSTTKTPDAILYGDANNDNEVNLADAVLIMQSIANPNQYGIKGSDKNHITEKGLKNADCCNPGDGVTNSDALSVQKYKLGIIKKLPEVK